MKKILSLVLAACMLMSLGMAAASADELKELHTYELASSEVEYFNYFRTQSAPDLNVLLNCIDSLLSMDVEGKINTWAAKEYYSNDEGKTWTFLLNDGMTWVDNNGNYKADVVAEDWLTGLEWILNFAKNESANTSMPIEMIEGAGEYYEYTKALTESEGEEAAKALGLEKFKETVKISAPDDKTLVYTCVDKLPYFPSLAQNNSMWPLSQGLIDEIGVDGFKNAAYNTMWYNGPYTITSFIHGNEKVLTARKDYFARDTHKLFDTVTYKMVESLDTAYTLFQTGELDHVDLTQSTLSTIAANPSHEFHSNLAEKLPTGFSYQIHFSYDKKLENGDPDVNWNTAVANEAFRLSWYYGLDATPYLARTNAINPLSCTNYTYCANNVGVTSTGVNYTQLVLDELGLEYSRETYKRADTEKAAAYKAQAIEELTAKGVTFPIEVDHYIQGGNQTAKDTADTLAQMFKDCLGEDYVKFNIKTYVSSLSQEVRNPQLASYYINGWGADFSDPVNCLGQETYGDDNAYYSQYLSKINNATDETLIATYKEFTKLEKAAAAITGDLDARYAAFAKAEAYFVSHALTIPLHINITWQLTSINDYSKLYGNTRYADWQTNSDLYTTEEYETFAAAKAAAK